MSEPSVPDGRDINFVKRVISDKYAAEYDSAAIFKFLDAHFMCHVGFQLDSHKFPVVMPMLFGRKDNCIFLHGYVSGRLVKSLRVGTPVCVTVTQLDGIVCALSLFNSSANYQSAVIFGHSSLVVEEDEKLEGLKAITESIFPGRWDDARPPNPIELRTTGLIKVEIEKMSMKSRHGPPGDDDEDLQNEELLGRCWAGVLPIHTTFGEPQQAPYSKTDGLPGYLGRLIQQQGMDLQPQGTPKPV